MKMRVDTKSLPKIKVTIDPSLSRFENVVLAPKKLAEAEEALKNIKLPPR